jgi:hypothetical protein
MTHTSFRLGTSTKFSRESRRALIAISFMLALLAAASFGFHSTRASSPSGVTINPTATTPVTWVGTATGGGALNAPLGLIAPEDLCQEGLSCDTFTLTVGGTAADWSGKLIRVKIEWLLPVTDYDLYIHKDSNSGPLVASSGRGATASAFTLFVRFTTQPPWQINITAAPRSRVSLRHHQHLRRQLKPLLVTRTISLRWRWVTQQASRLWA